MRRLILPLCLLLFVFSAEARVLQIDNLIIQRINSTANASVAAATCGAGEYSTYNGSYFNCSTPVGGGSSNLTGSGTANYLSKWDNTSDLGNSVLFQNGSAVGVNKADVDAIFDVESPLPAYGSSYWTYSAGIAMISTASINNYDRATYAFHTDSAGIGDYVRLDLGGAPQAFNVVYISLSGDVGAIWSVQWSDDNATWTTVATADVKNGVSGAGTLETTWTTPAATHRYWQLNNTVGGAGGSYHTEVQFSTDGGLDIAAYRTGAGTGFLFDASGDIQFKDVGTTRYTLGNDETDDNLLKICTTSMGTQCSVAIEGSTQHVFLGEGYNTYEDFNSAVTIGNTDSYTDYGKKENCSLAILSGSGSSNNPSICYGWSTSTAYDDTYDCGWTSLVVDASNAMRHALLGWCQRNNSFSANVQTMIRLDRHGVGIGFDGKDGVVPSEALEVYGQGLFHPDSAAKTPLVVKQIAGQSANLTEWQDSGGSPLAVVSEYGYFKPGECAGNYGAGEICYNSTDNKHYGYNGTALNALY